MKSLLSVLFCFVFIFGLAQDAMDRDVPDAVQKKFNKKFPGAENISWDKIDNNYKADFFFKDRGTYVEFTPEGEWVLTVTDLDTREIYPPIDKYLNENFRRGKIVLAEKSLTADKQDYYYVQVAQKIKGSDELAIFELFFDKTGRIEEVIIPEGFEDMTVVGIDDRNTEVPAIVIDSWQKRFPNASGIEWEKNPDPSDSTEYSFVGTFTYKEEQTTAEYTPDGEWLQTITEMNHKNIFPPIDNYLKSYFGKEKILLAEKAVSGTGDDYYYIKLAHKEADRKTPYIFELIFDKAGNIEQAYLPDGFEDYEIAGLEKRRDDIPPAVIKSWKKRFPRSAEIIWSKGLNPSDTIEFNFLATFKYRDRPTIAEFLPTGKWIETRAEYKEKELYAPVLKYIEENHWDDELIIAEKVTRADRKGYYYVRLERMKKGQFRPYVFQLYFSKSGIIQRVDRPEELKSQYYLTVDIPKQVARKFKSRFPRAKDIKWETSESNWVANFTDNEMPTVAIFTDSAQWVQTTAEMDVKNIYSPVQRYLDKEYSGYKSVYAEKVTRKDRNNHYYVELVSRKKNLSPQKLYLYFDKLGRPKEEE